MMLIAFIVVAVAALAFALGPRVTVDTRVTFDPSLIGADPDAWLASREAAVENIRPGLQKEIVWANPATKAKTPVALVYVHGFSASKGEVRPLPDKVAQALGANLFYTRLTGHAQGGAAMATGSVNAWVNDFAEAIAVCRVIGEHVVVICTSTGGALTTWPAAQPRLAEGIAAIVALSPNYGVRSVGASLLTLPWGRQLAKLLIGEERRFEPVNELNARFWTTRYPSRSLLPMAAMSELARNGPVQNIRIPALFVFSDKDRVVRPDLTRQIAGRWGAPHELLPIDHGDDAYSHVLAGDAISPGTTDMIAERIVAWLKAVLPKASTSA